jgi:chromosome segregation ATPase
METIINLITAVRLLVATITNEKMRKGIDAVLAQVELAARSQRADHAWMNNHIDELQDEVRSLKRSAEEADREFSRQEHLLTKRYDEIVGLKEEVESWKNSEAETTLRLLALEEKLVRKAAQVSCLEQENEDLIAELEVSTKLSGKRKQMLAEMERTARKALSARDGLERQERERDSAG